MLDSNATSRLLNKSDPEGPVPGVGMAYGAPHRTGENSQGAHSK